MNSLKDNMNRVKARKFLDDNQSEWESEKSDRVFYLGICFVLLEDYSKASQQFERALSIMLNPPTFWEMSGQPNWLVDVCTLSGNNNFWPDVIREVDLYNSTSRETSLVTYYSYGLIELLFPSDLDLSRCIQNLLKITKVKYMYAAGQALQAIVNEDSIALNNALLALLQAHKGMAKYGTLRYTPEGLLCMPAMSLAYAARKRSLKVEIQNDYFPMEYISFLMEKDAQN